MYNKDSSARTEQKPLKPIRQHAVWLLLAFFLALSFFATRNLLERFDSLQDASQERQWTGASSAIGLLIHELQRERGLSAKISARFWSPSIAGPIFPTSP